MGKCISVFLYNISSICGGFRQFESAADPPSEALAPHKLICKLFVYPDYSSVNSFTLSSAVIFHPVLLLRIIHLINYSLSIPFQSCLPCSFITIETISPRMAFGIITFNLMAFVQILFNQTGPFRIRPNNVQPIVTYIEMGSGQSYQITLRLLRDKIWTD